MWAPWQGKTYSSRRLLILGQSCYSWMEGGELIHPENDHPQMLAEWAIAEPNKSIPFLRKITRGLCGVESPSHDQSRDAWESIAFTNYIPVTVGEGHIPNPNAAARRQAAQEWPQLLNMLSPRIIIVLGPELWNWMPKTQVILSDYVQGYTLDNGGTAMCHVIGHPSRGPSWREYATFIRAAEQV